MAQIENRPKYMKPTEPGIRFGGLNDSRVEIFTDYWEHIASCQFGEGRVSWYDKQGQPMTKWTGDSYKYDIFHNEALSAWGLRWGNGSGEGWIIYTDNTKRGQANILAHIALLGPETLRWDLCHALYEGVIGGGRVVAAEKAAYYQQLFLDGRLKKRVRGGVARCEVQPKIG